MKDCIALIVVVSLLWTVSSPKCEKAAKGVIPSNTWANSNWAMKNFKELASNRSATMPNDCVPPELLESQDPELLCKWLCRYVMEMWRTGRITICKRRLLYSLIVIWCNNYVCSSIKNSTNTKISVVQSDCSRGQNPVEEKPAVTHDVCCQSSSGTTQPNLSGTFSNCTINLCFK